MNRKKTPGGTWTHTGHTDRRTNLTTIPTHQRTRATSRRPQRPTQPGTQRPQPRCPEPTAPRSPRPTRRPPPANPYMNRYMNRSIVTQLFPPCTCACLCPTEPDVCDIFVPCLAVYIVWKGFPTIPVMGVPSPELPLRKRGVRCVGRGGCKVTPGVISGSSTCVGHQSGDISQGHQSDEPRAIL